jgi:hypothetical protein
VLERRASGPISEHNSVVRPFEEIAKQADKLRPLLCCQLVPRGPQGELGHLLEIERVEDDLPYSLLPLRPFVRTLETGILQDGGHRVQALPQSVLGTCGQTLVKSKGLQGVFSASCSGMI